MQRATVSTILVSTRSLPRVAGDALRVSPLVRLRQAAVAFPAGNRSVPSSPGSILRSWGRGDGRTSKSRAFPMHAHMCRLAVSRYRLAALAVKRVPRGELWLEFTRSPFEATLEAPNRPLAVNHCRGLTCPRGGSRTAAPALPTGTKRHPQRALMAIAESEYVLVAEIFRICVFSSSYVAVSKRLTTSLLM